MATPNSIAVPNEVDAWIVQLEPNTSYVAIVSGASSEGTSTLPDPFVGVGNLETSEVIAVQDNTDEGGLDPLLPFQVPASGDYLVAVGDLTGGTGSYLFGVFDQQGNLQPAELAAEIVVDPVPPMTSSTGPLGPPPGEDGGSVGLTGLPDSDFSPGTI